MLKKTIIDLKNQFSVLTFNITNSTTSDLILKSVRLSTDNKQITGDYTADFKEQNITFGGKNNNSNVKINVLNGAIAQGASADVTCTINADDITGSKLTAILSFENGVTYKTEYNSEDIQNGDHYTKDLDFSSSQVIEVDNGIDLYDPSKFDGGLITNLEQLIAAFTNPENNGKKFCIESGWYNTGDGINIKNSIELTGRWSNHQPILQAYELLISPDNTADIDIKFDNVSFSYNSWVIKMSPDSKADVDNLSFNNCLFNTNWSGTIKLFDHSETSTLKVIKNVSITNSTFLKVSTYLLEAYNNIEAGDEVLGKINNIYIDNNSFFGSNDEGVTLCQIDPNDDSYATNYNLTVTHNTFYNIKSQYAFINIKSANMGLSTITDNIFYAGEAGTTFMWGPDGISANNCFFNYTSTKSGSTDITEDPQFADPDGTDTDVFNDLTPQNTHCRKLAKGAWKWL